jgi:hypothetical protein
MTVPRRTSEPIASVFLGLFLLFAPAAHAASLLPLQSESAAPLPSGTLEAVLGVSYFNNQRFPLFTPAGFIRNQDRVSLPEIAFRVGAGDWVEIQAAYELIYLDESTAAGSDSTYGSGDARLHAKARLLREAGHWPGLGIRFGTKLPNASKDDRLGTDEIDFGIEVLASKDFGPLESHLNLGILLLDNPGPVAGAPNRDSDGQDDLFTYSVALASRPLGADSPGAFSLRFLAEVAGYAGSRSRFDNDRTDLALGMQLRSGGFTLYSGASVGLVTASENYGLRLGVIYAFELARLAGLGE